MVQSLIKIDDATNRVLGVVKAKYGLKDKGEAVVFVVNRYVQEQNEPELRPDFIEKIRNIEKQKNIKVKDFAKRYGLKNVRP